LNFEPTTRRLPPSGWGCHWAPVVLSAVKYLVFSLRKGG
jgi:hypothetical protein